MSTPTQAPEVPVYAAPPVKPWFKKKRFVIPGILAILFVIGSAGGSSPKSGSAPLPQAAPVAAPVVPAPVEAPPAPPVVEPAPVAEPVASTCDVVREALLTGTPAKITASMKALIADKTAPATAREYARYHTVRDKGNKDLQGMDESLITMACS